MIVIIDYGMGNLASVAKAVESLGEETEFTDSLAKIKTAKKIILPGVGHFAQAVCELKKRKLYKLIKDRIKEGVPFLGICVGMQLLFETSQEAPGVKGLAVFTGEVKRFNPKKIIVPHMGWNSLKFNNNNILFNAIQDGSYFYFAHSYYCKPEDKNIVLTFTNYGIDFASSLYNKNVWAVQFHPEKSQKLGLKVLSNFLGS